LQTENLVDLKEVLAKIDMSKTSAEMGSWYAKVYSAHCWQVILFTLQAD
jgi:hypothetical protein